MLSRCSSSLGRRSPRHLSRLVDSVLLLAAACSAESAISANGIPSRTFDVGLGQEVALTLQTVGPGAYASPPVISGAAVEFLDVALVMPSVPAGPTQRFRFMASARGQAIVQFRQTVSGLIVEDTIIVR
jgi:hypothetical protein